MLRTVIVIGSLVWALSVHATIYQITPQDDIRAAIATLKPGDELRLSGGVYALSSRFNTRLPAGRTSRSSFAPRAGRTC